MTTANGGALRVTRSQATSVVRETIRFLLAIALTRLLGRGLDPGDFGFVAYVGTLYALTHTALDHGSGALIVREIGRDPSREKPLLEFALAWRGVLGLFLGAIVAALGFTEGDPSRRAWMFVVAASSPLLSLSVLGAVFQTRQDLGPPSAIGVLTQAATLVAAAALFDLDVVPAAFVALYVGRETIGPAALWLVARARHGVRLRPGFEGRGARPLFSAATTQAGAVVFQTASLHAGMLAAKAFAPEDDVGAYAAATRLANPVALLLGALAAPLLPVFASAFARDRAASARLLRAALSLGACFAATGVVAFGCDPAAPLDLVYGVGRYAGATVALGAPDAVPTLVALVMALACVCVGAPATTALLADGGERPLRRAFFLGLLSNGACLVALACGGGVVMGGIGLFAAELVVLVATLRALSRRAAAPFDKGALLGPFLSAGVVVVAYGGLSAVGGGVAPFASIAAGACGVLFAIVGPPGRTFRAALAGVPS